MKNILHRRDRIVITTIEIMNELGIQGLSTREIARREGVSEATLFRHYKNKNGLLLAVLDFYTQYDQDIYETTRIKKLDPLEAIRFIVTSTAEYYQNYPAMVAITQMMYVLQYEEELYERINSIIFTRSQTFKQLIDEAKLKGKINQDISSECLSDIILGSFFEICLKWRLKKDFNLKERVEENTNIILDHIIKR